MINIYTAYNGVGLQRDANILKQIFTDANIYNQYDRNVTSCDIALHLEIPRIELLNKAKKNILVPNPEWYFETWTNQIGRFDYIFCKTFDCLSIFQKYNENCIYTGFTSFDMYDNTIEKYKTFFHLQGKSSDKSTEEVLHVFDVLKQYKLVMVSSKINVNTDNVLTLQNITDDKLKQYMNMCLFHVCPSRYEGFGHYIHEAKSCKAVVICTDGSPMNEFFNDKSLLVETRGYIKGHLARKSLVNIDSLIDKINAAYQLKTTKEIGNNNRSEFIDDDKEFRQRIVTVMQNI